MHTKTTTILALAASLALAATDEEQPARRRLRDTVDLTRVHEKAEAEALTGALSFKLDAAAAAATQGGRAARLGWRGRAPYLVSRRLSVAKFYLLKLRERRTRPRGPSASRGAAARS